MPPAEKPPARFSAWWVPAWYDLDPALEVGRASAHLLHRTAPAGSPGPWVFRAGTVTGREAEETRFVHARVEAIRHPALGALRAVEIGDLVYTMHLADGRRLVVDSEEDPGASEVDVRDWTLQVELARVPHPLYDLLETAQLDPARLSARDWDQVAAAGLDPDFLIAGLADALVRRSGIDPAPALLAALRSEDDALRRDAIERLREHRCASADVGAALMDVVRSRHVPLAYRAAQALAALRPADAAALAAEIGRWDAVDRRTVLTYCARGPSVNAALLAAFRADPDAEVRRIAGRTSEGANELI